MIDHFALLLLLPMFDSNAVMTLTVEFFHNKLSNNSLNLMTKIAVKRTGFKDFFR